MCIHSRQLIDLLLIYCSILLICARHLLRCTLQMLSFKLIDVLSPLDLRESYIARIYTIIFLPVYDEVRCLDLSVHKGIS
jgi:hypothetical protein